MKIQKDMPIKPLAYSLFVCMKYIESLTKPGVTVGASDSAVDETDKSPFPSNAYTLVKGDSNKQNKEIEGTEC